MSSLVSGVIFFEFMILLMQIVRVLERPKDRRRLWYLILLLFLILNNLCGIFLPDQRFFVSVEFQQIFSSVVASAMAVYFGYYFYKAFNLNNPQAFLSNKTLLSIPFMALFILLEQDSAARLNLLPLFCSGWIIYSVATLLIKKIRRLQKREGEEKMPVIIAAYCALLCWVVIPFSSLFGDFKMVNLLLVNIGFIVLTIVYTYCLVKNDVIEYDLKLDQVVVPLFDGARVEANYIKYKFTKREIEVVSKVLSGQLNKEIADSLFISNETVKKHVSNILKKARVNSKSELINKLNL